MVNLDIPSQEEQKKMSKKYRLDIPPNTKLSPALRRLIEEVRNEQDHPKSVRYDRIHSRHNRSVG